MILRVYHNDLGLFAILFEKENETRIGFFYAINTIHLDDRVNLDVPIPFPKLVPLGSTEFKI